MARGLRRTRSPRAHSSRNLRACARSTPRKTRKLRRNIGILRDCVGLVGARGIRVVTRRPSVRTARTAHGAVPAPRRRQCAAKASRDTGLARESGSGSCGAPPPLDRPIISFPRSCNVHAQTFTFEGEIYQVTGPWRLRASAPFRSSWRRRPGRARSRVKRAARLCQRAVEVGTGWTEPPASAANLANRSVGPIAPAVAAVFALLDPGRRPAHQFG
jgi:hypothetical protein